MTASIACKLPSGTVFSFTEERRWRIDELEQPSDAELLVEFNLLSGDLLSDIGPQHGLLEASIVRAIEDVYGVGEFEFTIHAPGDDENDEEGIVY